MAKKSKVSFAISAYFPYTADFEKKDAKLEKIVGRPSNGSGAGFGQRDLCWYFDSEDEAEKIYNKLKKVRWLDECSLNKLPG